MKSLRRLFRSGYADRHLRPKTQVRIRVPSGSILTTRRPKMARPNTSNAPVSLRWIRPLRPGDTIDIDTPESGTPARQKLNVLAAAESSSTTCMALTIPAPSRMSASVIPRGAVHAPQAQISPPADTNWAATSESGGRPSVPRRDQVACPARWAVALTVPMVAGGLCARASTRSAVSLA